MKHRFWHGFLIFICSLSVLAFAEGGSFEKIKMQAEDGNAQAQFKLGIMYFYGQETAQNYMEALKWFNKAAKQNNPKAQYNLGVMYSLGEGVPQDYIKSYIWFSLAYSNGFEQAKSKILLLNKVMTASEMENAAAQAAEMKKYLKK